MTNAKQFLNEHPEFLKSFQEIIGKTKEDTLQLLNLLSIDLKKKIDTIIEVTYRFIDEGDIGAVDINMAFADDSRCCYILNRDNGVVSVGFGGPYNKPEVPEWK